MLIPIETTQDIHCITILISTAMHIKLPIHQQYLCNTYVISIFNYTISYTYGCYLLQSD